MMASSSVRVLSSSFGSLTDTDTLSGLILVVKVAPDVRHLVGFAICDSLCILVICLLVSVCGVPMPLSGSCCGRSSFGGVLRLRSYRRRVLRLLPGSLPGSPRASRWCGYCRLLRAFRLCIRSSYLLWGSLLSYYTLVAVTLISVLVICLLVCARLFVCRGRVAAHLE